MYAFHLKSKTFQPHIAQILRIINVPKTYRRTWSSTTSAKSTNYGPVRCGKPRGRWEQAQSHNLSVPCMALVKVNWAQILEMIRKILHSNSFPSWSCIIIYNYFNNWQLPDSLWLNACANLLAEYSARKRGIYGKEWYASLCLLYKETFTGVTKGHGIVWNGINLNA